MHLLSSTSNATTLVFKYHLKYCCCSVGKSCLTLLRHGLQYTELPCPSSSPRVYPSSCPQNWWCHPTISSSVALFSFCLQSFPASGSFPMSQLFTSGGRNIGASASASVLPKSIQGWFSLGLTGLISLLSKGLSDSQESSPAPQFESINSLALCLLYCLALTSVHDYRKDHSLDYMDLCQQSDVFAFHSCQGLP